MSTAAPQSDQDAVVAVVVRADQLGANITRSTPPGGDTVNGEVTLDLCGASFPSEALRTARLQVVYSVNGAGFASNEVVSYSAGGTAQAMAEVRHAAATCPHHPVQSVVAGVPPLMYTVTSLPRLSAWPMGTLAYRLAATDGKRTKVSVGIYMWRGRVFSGVYGPATTDGQPTTLLLHLAAVAAANLAATASGESSV